MVGVGASVPARAVRAAHGVEIGRVDVVLAGRYIWVGMGVLLSVMSRLPDARVGIAGKGDGVGREGGGDGCGGVLGNVAVGGL